MTSIIKERFHVNRQELIDKLFRRANEAGNVVYKNTKTKNYIKRIKEAELQRVNTFYQVLDNELSKILFTFPKIEDLPLFYQKLLDALIGVKFFKQKMGFLNKLRKKIKEEKNKAVNKIKGANKKEDIIKARKSFFGKVVSILEDIPFEKYNEWVKVFYSLPYFEENSFKYVILGAPNVGKSTLLSKITPSEPKIADYEFTTTIVNRGELDEEIEVFDTPGVLDRDFSELNKIEKEALAAFQALADAVIYVIDPTKDLKKQLNILKRFYNEKNDVPYYIYLSKYDILGEKIKEKVKEIKEFLNKENINVKDIVFEDKNLKEYFKKEAHKLIKQREQKN
jgi:nucleolar GTP-binding protein